MIEPPTDWTRAVEVDRRRCQGPSDDSFSPCQVTIYTARRIITMQPALSDATAVAVVVDGRFAGVSRPDSVLAWAGREGAVVVDTLSDRVLMPGLIDPHVHPSLPAVLTQFPFLRPGRLVAADRGLPQALTRDVYVSWLLT